MTDHTKAQTVDSDLPFFCAYSLPAVALTLGPDNWSLLKPTFETLAQDMQVRTPCSITSGIIYDDTIVTYCSFNMHVYLSLM